MVYGRTEKKVMKAEYVPVNTARGQEFTEEKKLKIWNSIVKTIEHQRPYYKSKKNLSKYFFKQKQWVLNLVPDKIPLSTLQYSRTAKSRLRRAILS